MTNGEPRIASVRGASALPAAALFLAACAAVASLFLSCADPYPEPHGRVEILAAWDVYDAECAGAAVALRVSRSGAMVSERFGATVRVDSDRRRYWASIVEDCPLPAGASTTRTLSVAFAEPDERLAPGSAVVEDLWFD